MPLTTVDPVPALIVVDLQQGLAQAPTVHPMPDVVAHAAELVRAFRARDLPVVVVTASGRAPGRTDRAPRDTGAFPPGFDEPMDKLGAHPDDIRVDKQRWGAFLGTDLDSRLRARDVTQVVVIGVATSAGVESTARSAHDLGYHVVLAVDAMSDTDADLHDNSVERVFPKLGETATTAQIVAALAR